MAPTHVQTQRAETSASTTTLTYSNFAVGAGANRSLVACALWRDASASSPTVSSIVFNTSETFGYPGARAQFNYTGGSYVCAEVWTLDNPTNTTADIVLTLSEAPATNDGIALVISEYTGANNGVSATGTATGNSTTVDVGITTNNSDSTIVSGVAVVSGPYSFAPDAGTTERYDDNVLTVSYAAFEKAASGGADTVEAECSTANNFAHLAVELLAASAGDLSVTISNVAAYQYTGVRVVT